MNKPTKPSGGGRCPFHSRSLPKTNPPSTRAGQPDRLRQRVASVTAACIRGPSPSAGVLPVQSAWSPPPAIVRRRPSTATRVRLDLDSRRASPHHSPASRARVIVQVAPGAAPRSSHGYWDEVGAEHLVAVAEEAFVPMPFSTGSEVGRRSRSSVYHGIVHPIRAFQPCDVGLGRGAGGRRTWCPWRSGRERGRTFGHLGTAWTAWAVPARQRRLDKARYTTSWRGPCNRSGRLICAACPSKTTPSATASHWHPPARPLPGGPGAGQFSVFSFTSSPAGARPPRLRAGNRLGLMCRPLGLFLWFRAAGPPRAPRAPRVEVILRRASGRPSRGPVAARNCCSHLHRRGVQAGTGTRRLSSLARSFTSPASASICPCAWRPPAGVRAGRPPSCARPFPGPLGNRRRMRAWSGRPAPRATLFTAMASISGGIEVGVQLATRSPTPMVFVRRRVIEFPGL